MDVRESREGSVCLVHVAGRIDSSNAETYTAALLPMVERALEGGCQGFVLELSGLAYINSTGLRAFHMMSKKAAGKLPFAVAGLSPVIGEIFHISRFDKVFKVHPTAQDAVAAMGG